MTALQIIELLQVAMRIAESVGVNYQKVAEIRAIRHAEGRDLTAEDLYMLAEDAQAAIDKL